MCVGEIVFLTGQPRTADVIALLRAFSSELASKLASASHQLTLLEHHSMESSTEPCAAAGGGASLLQHVKRCWALDALRRRSSEGCCRKMDP